MEIGDKVQITGYIKRYWDPKDNVVFTSIPFPSDGVYIGTRYMKKGYRTFHAEDGPQFIQTGTLKVYLIVLSKHRNPIRCLPSQIYKTQKQEAFEWRTLSILNLQVAEKYITETITLLQKDELSDDDQRVEPSQDVS